MSEYEEYSESLLYNKESDQLKRRVAQLEKELYRTTRKLEDTRREQEEILRTAIVPHYEPDKLYIEGSSVYPGLSPTETEAPPTTAGTTGEKEFDPDAPGAFVAQKYKESKEKWIAVYPAQGLFPSGTGLNTFTFENGRVRLYNGQVDSLSGNLAQFRARWMEGIFFWSDQDCDIKFYADGLQTSTILYDQASDWADVDVEFDRLDVRFTYPGNFQLIAETKSNQQISMLRHLPRMARYASGTTTNVATPVQWQATNGLAGGRSSTTATNPLLHVPAILTKTFLVFNLDTANSMSITLQGKADLDSANFANDTTTGASTTVAAGASKTLQTTTGYQFMQLLVSSTVANASAKFEVQMSGTGT